MHGAMPFTAPKTAAFKQFVILDGDGVVSALSAIDGGQIDEILTRSAQEDSGEAGGQINVKVAKGGGKRAKGRKVEEEVRRARTRHATAAKLLETLHAHDSVGKVDGTLDMTVLQQVEAGMVLQFRAELRLHPLHQADQMLRSFVHVAPKFGEKQAAAALRSILPLWGTLVGTGETDARLLLEPRTAESQVPRLLMPIPHLHLEVQLDDLLGEVTVLAQVERVLADGEDYPAVRMLRGAPSSQFERTALEESLPELIDGLSELGVPISSEDIFVPGPALILRAVCAYR